MKKQLNLGIRIQGLMLSVWDLFLCSNKEEEGKLETEAQIVALQGIKTFT